MISYYDLENKPQFKYGEIVKVDFKKLCGSDCGIVDGKIVGKGMEHIIDTWLIEFDRDFAPTYPYKVVGIPHVCIVMGFEYQ